MDRSPEKHEPSEPGEPSVTRRRWRVSLVWLVPLVAALIGLSLVVQAWEKAGPQITISFRTASGLEAGKTLVKYKHVVIGKVVSIALSRDDEQVIATVDLDRRAAGFARKGTRFWVVRPRVGFSGVSGIDTVLSGSYISVDRGKSDEPRKHFVGLDEPPAVSYGTPGKIFILHSADLGSLNINAPVYYRRIQVGRVASYALDSDGKGVTVHIFVKAPYDRFVTTATRFWNASGVDVSLGASGLQLRTQSLATIIDGGIAFATPMENAGAPAKNRAQFVLAKDRQTALEPTKGRLLLVRMRFGQPLRGLAVGAPVDFFGMTIGSVQSIRLDYSKSSQRFSVVVDAAITPQRLGPVLRKLPEHGNNEARYSHLMQRLVARGMRAQARTANLLTGQLYISLDFMPNAKKAHFDPETRPLTIPTADSSFERVQEQAARIVAKIEKIPFDSIGRNLNADLAALHMTLKQVNHTTLPKATDTLGSARHTLDALNGVLAEDSPLQQNLADTLKEIRLTAYSLRALSDLLSRHPEALLRGLPASPPPPAHAAAPTSSGAAEATKR